MSFADVIAAASTEPVGKSQGNTALNPYPTRSARMHSIPHKLQVYQKTLPGYTTTFREAGGTCIFSGSTASIPLPPSSGNHST